MGRVSAWTFLLSSACAPLFISVLLFYPNVLADHPAQRFLLALLPFWWAYFFARWHIRMAELSAPLYHPLGCLSQCCVWVFHWVVVLYHAFFIRMYTMGAFVTTIFCVAIVVVEEGLFHSLLTVCSSDPAHLGTYEKARRAYAQGFIIWAKLWYLVEGPLQQDEAQNSRPIQSRSMTM